jgi:RNA polymerase sigma-70 factor (ECF subfamily)
MTNLDNQSETSQLLQRASAGADANAVRELFQRHRQRLGRMLAVHMHPRLRARVDPSDIIQETLLQASRQLVQYLHEQPMPFYPWLRQIAWERLMHLHAQHLRAYKRSALREAPPAPTPPDHSVADLADQLSASITSPSAQVMRGELRHGLRTALVKLPAIERDVLVLRYLEQLSIQDIAAVLGISDAAATKRHIRGLEHLRAAMAGTSTG